MAEAIERNTYQVNKAGTYKDPQTGSELEVRMEVGADALVRLGWEFQYGLDEAPKTEAPATKFDSNKEE